MKSEDTGSLTIDNDLKTAQTEKLALIVLILNP